MGNWVYTCAVCIVLAAVVLIACRVRQGADPAVSSSHPQSPAQSDAEQAFWKWFDANKSILADGMIRGDAELQHLTSSRIRAEMAKVRPGLGFLMHGKEDGTHGFIVTADGAKDNIAAVQSLVAAAPAMEGWSAAAFRPRAAMTRVKYRGVELGVDDVWFQAFRGPEGQIGITLYVRGLPKENYGKEAGAAILLLDHALGEYDSLTKIDSLEAEPLPDDPAGAGLRPFLEIVPLIDSVRR